MKTLPAAAAHWIYVHLDSPSTPVVKLCVCVGGGNVRKKRVERRRSGRQGQTYWSLIRGCHGIWPSPLSSKQTLLGNLPIGPTHSSAPLGLCFKSEPQTQLHTSTVQQTHKDFILVPTLCSVNMAVPLNLWSLLFQLKTTLSFLTSSLLMHIQCTFFTSCLTTSCFLFFYFRQYRF